MVPQTVYIIPLVLFTTGINPDTSHVSLSLLSLRPAPYILVQKAVILNSRLTIFGRTVNKKCLVSETSTV